MASQSQRNRLRFPRYIPLEVIHPIVKEYCDNREMGMIVQEADKPHQINHYVGQYSAPVALAFESGVYERTVHDIYRGKMEYNSKRKKRATQVKWSTVDKLLTAMDLVHLWYEKPLSEYYSLRPSQYLIESAA